MTDQTVRTRRLIRLLYSLSSVIMFCRALIHLSAGLPKSLTKELTKIKISAHDSLRKHAYSNILKISPPNKWKFSDKTIRWGGSNEYSQSMFLTRNKKIDVYPCKPQFYFRGSKLYRRVFVMLQYINWTRPLLQTKNSTWAANVFEVNQVFRWEMRDMFSYFVENIQICGIHCLINCL